MTPPSNPVIAKAKPVNLDPGIAARETPLEFAVDLGGAFEFKNESKDFFHFEITFDNPGPPGVSNTLSGTADDPIFVQMPHATRTFKGHIVFKKKDRTPAGDAVPFLAKSCPACG